MGQNPTDSEVNDMINEVDVDGSGVVEFEEFVNFFSRLMKNLNPQNEVREAFRRFVHSLTISLKIDRLNDDTNELLYCKTKKCTHDNKPLQTHVDWIASELHTYNVLKYLYIYA